jgi:hypothetical protein
MSNSKTTIQLLESLMDNSIGMIDNLVVGTANVTEVYSVGTGIALTHTKHLAEKHAKHDTIKSEELDKSIATLPKSQQARIKALRERINA